MSEKKVLRVRALRADQAGTPLYSFFLEGRALLDIAEISRLSRSDDALEGFQRDAIRRHINSIVDYLNQGDVLFPNAVLLALSPRVKFEHSRGPKDGGAGSPGTLTIPIRSNGPKCAWIVDGQQRSTALAKAKNGTLPVPVIAFVSDDLKVHREQFVLVNKARPLPRAMIDELLPELDPRHLPSDLAVRQVPSALVNLLDQDSESPFFGLIRRASTSKDPARFVHDAALIKTLKQQIGKPLGALAKFRTLDNEEADAKGMYLATVSYWAEVKNAFPEAWGLPAEQSRLMHSAGVEAMGELIDYLVQRARPGETPSEFMGATLRAIAPKCAWTTGRWPDLGLAWNEIENTPKSIARLKEQLCRLAQAVHMQQAA